MITATRNSALCLHLTQLFLSDGGHINEKLPAGAMTETDQGKVQFSAAQPFFHRANRYENSTWTLFDLNGTEPVETPVLTAAVRKVHR